MEWLFITLMALTLLLTGFVAVVVVYRLLKTDNR